MKHSFVTNFSIPRLHAEELTRHVPPSRAASLAPDAQSTSAVDDAPASSSTGETPTEKALREGNDMMETYIWIVNEL